MIESTFDWRELQALRELVNLLWDAFLLLPQCVAAEEDKILVRRFIASCLADIQESKIHPLRLSLYLDRAARMRDCCAWVYPTIPTEKVPVAIFVPFNGHGEDTDVSLQAL